MSEYPTPARIGLVVPANVLPLADVEAALAAQLAAKATALAPSDDAGFALLATQNSEDLDTRGTGGDLGFIDKTRNYRSRSSTPH